ncbi:MAG: fatty acid desaturase, partial [Gammaproteobacteria bacterium]
MPTPDASAALAARAERQASVEMPTLGVALLVYGGWLAITLAYGRWPLIIVAPLAAVLITLHGSLQHEIVHGHPTRWRGINR